MFASKAMAISMSKKKFRLPRRVEAKELTFSKSILPTFLYRIPTAILLLILVFLWSSSTTIISGNIVHVCVSSRKLSNLYCLSAGTQRPNVDIPVSFINNGSINGSVKSSTNEVVDGGSINGDIKSSTNEVAFDGTSINDDVKSSTNEVADGGSINGDAKSSTNEVADGAGSINGGVKSSTNEVADGIVKGSTYAVADVVVDDQLIVDNRTAQERYEEELAIAVKMVEGQLRLHRSWKMNSNPTTCEGRGVYVYELPPKFNKDLVSQCGDMIPWLEDFCKYFSNRGFGEPIEKLGKGWYQTHQYSLEPIFHDRVLNHPCRVYDENEAKLFYVPFYGGLDILRWHFRNVSNDVKDTLGSDLMKWLDSQSPWVRNSGKDHMFVLGKISWDFRRKSGSTWGTRFLELDQMQNPIKLLIERQPWHPNDIGIPHPTHFHPHSDDEIIAWQRKIISSNRSSLVSFAGGARPDAPENIRSLLITQCNLAGNGTCRLLNCSSGECDQPEMVIEMFMESEFCLQPPGDSPTRKSVFDSLVSGCIPVLFDPFTAYYQYPWHLPEDHDRFSVFVKKEEVKKMNINVVETLMKIPKHERDDMRRYIVYELLPGLVYGDSTSGFEKFQDAFSITMNNLFERVSRLE